MGATTKLLAPVADADDAYPITVLLSKQRHRAFKDGVFVRNDLFSNRKVRPDGCIYAVLHLAKLLLGQTARPVKVEAKAVRGNERACLGRVPSQHLLKCLVQK